jgi:hypothetical protein
VRSRVCRFKEGNPIPQALSSRLGSFGEACDRFRTFSSIPEIARPASPTGLQGSQVSSRGLACPREQGCSRHSMRLPPALHPPASPSIRVTRRRTRTIWETGNDC